MAFKRITAILNNDRLAAVENELKKIGVPRISLSHATDFGVQKNFSYRDWIEPFAKLRIHVTEDHADAVI